MTFSSISVLTRVTPDLEPPEQVFPDGGPFCFIPTSTARRSSSSCWSPTGRARSPSTAARCCSSSGGRNANQTELRKVAKAYWDLPAGERQHHLARPAPRVRPTAKAPDGTMLDTTLATDTLEFDAAIAKPMLGRIAGRAAVLAGAAPDADWSSRR